MIQGAKRGSGGKYLVRHLLRGDENEDVEILPARGVVAVEFRPQLREIVARSAHGRTIKPIHHLHADPKTDWSAAQYARHLELYETEFELAGQPRLAVFHRKHGRGHRHYVWSLVRRDGSLISMSWDYARREKISRILEFEFGEWHIAGKHNRAVAWALRREGRIDVAASMEKAGLLEVERPVAKRTSAGREQEKRTRVRQATVESIVLAAWQATSDGATFEHALEADGLALAMGDEVPVLVDRTGNTHSLAGLIGRITKAEGGRRVGAAEVRARIDGLKLRSLSDVRLESQMIALTDDLESEIASVARRSVADPRQDLAADDALLADLAELIPIADILAVEKGLPEIAAMAKCDVTGLPGYEIQVRAAELLFDEAANLLVMGQENKLAATNDAEMAAAEMIDALDRLAMVPDGKKALEEETEHVAEPSQPGATNETQPNGYPTDGGEGASRRRFRIVFCGDAPEHAPYRGADGQNRRTSAGRPINAETPSGEDIAGPVGPHHPQSGAGDQPRRGNSTKATAGAGPSIQRRKPVQSVEFPVPSRPQHPAAIILRPRWRDLIVGIKRRVDQLSRWIRPSAPSTAAVKSRPLVRPPDNILSIRPSAGIMRQAKIAKKLGADPSFQRSAPSSANIVSPSPSYSRPVQPDTALHYSSMRTLPEYYEPAPGAGPELDDDLPTPGP